MKFRELLDKAGIKTQKQFGDILGLTEESISRWDGNPPQYAVAYLELLIKYNGVKT